MTVSVVGDNRKSCEGYPLWGANSGSRSSEPVPAAFLLYQTILAAPAPIERIDECSSNAEVGSSKARTRCSGPRGWRECLVVLTQNDASFWVSDKVIDDSAPEMRESRRHWPLVGAQCSNKQSKRRRPHRFQIACLQPFLIFPHSPPGHAA